MAIQFFMSFLALLPVDPLLGLLGLLVLLLLAHVGVELGLFGNVDSTLSGGSSGDTVDPGLRR